MDELLKGFTETETEQVVANDTLISSNVLFVVGATRAREA